MPVPDLEPSGRTLYEQASSAFVHNMPLEALCIVSSATASGKHRESARLSEQLLVLQITALFTVYSPNDIERLQASIRQWQRQSSGSAARRRRRVASGSMSSSVIEDEPTASTGSTADMSQSTGSLNGKEPLPNHLYTLLNQPPTVFLARLWAMCLRFCIDNPLVPSMQSSIPSEHSESISSTPETLTAPLQLPTSVCETLIAGALKLDLNLAQQPTNGQIKSKKETKDAGPMPGLQATRSICEWILSAFATIVMDERSVKERTHLQKQYSRVLHLYSLEVLGNRLGEWEYAREIVRCSQLLGSQQEVQLQIQERETLLIRIRDAELLFSRKEERQQAAREHAQRLLEEQIAKRVASASSTTASISASSGPSQSSPTTKKSATERSSLQRQDSSSSNSARSSGPSAYSSGQSSPSSSLSPTSEKAAPVEETLASYASAREKKQSTSTARSRTHEAAQQVPAKYSDNSGSEPNKRASLPATDPRRANHALTATITLESIRTSILQWLHRLGGTPAILSAAIAFVLFLRRMSGKAARRTIPALPASGAATSASSAAHLAANHRRAMAAAGSRDGSQGLTNLLWRKIADTLRMGTQVTYL